MWKRVAVVGATAVIIGGAGTAAFAASGTPAPVPSSSPISPTSDNSAKTSAEAGKTTQVGAHRTGDRLRRAVHGTWVTENKRTKTFTTHDAIRGQVTAVSPTSITVEAADNVTETYVINARTKVFTRSLRTAAPQTPAARTAASISDVKLGDSVFVGGTGTTTLTAIRVVDLRK